MRRTYAPLSSSFAAVFLTLSLVGCPAPEPPKAAPAHLDTEEDARHAFDDAKKKDDVDALFAVYRQYKRFSVGKQALRLAATRQLDLAREAAEACDESKAAGALASVALFTAEDPEIDTKYDEARDDVEREKGRCVGVKLDVDIKKAEAAWDFPRAFNRIRSEKDVDGGTLKRKREELVVRWSQFVDRSLKDIIAKHSIDAALGDKRAKWEASIDASQLPEDCGPLLDKLKGTLVGVYLVFDSMKEGQLLDPAIPYWTFGTPHARLPSTPLSSEGPTLSMGVPFQAVAKGKIADTSYLVAGKPDGDVYQRLASVKLLIQEDDARAYDTRAVLPESIMGMVVLAPIAQGSELLGPATVMSDKGGLVMVQPLAKKGSKEFVSTKRPEMRGMSLSVGQAVQVQIGTTWKKGEVADAPEEDRVLVKINGFESYVQLADVRVKRSDLPALPKEKEAKGGLLGL